MADRTEFHFFAPCPRGLEKLLADELRTLRAAGVRQQRSGVLFRGPVATGLRVVLWSRIASRVLLRLAECDASTADALYDCVRELVWEDHVRANGTLAVDAVGTNTALRNTQFTAVRVKDAIADRFRERFGRRPSVDVQAPDIRVNVAVREAKATVSLDLGGEALHRRGVRPERGVAAPLKENLGAALLLLAEWPRIAEGGGAFLDPCVGSGTLALEAALIAGDIAPGLLGGRPGVSRWSGLDESVWRGLLEEAEARREAGLLQLPTIVGTDRDPAAVEAARSMMRRAGLERRVRIERRAVEDAERPQGDDVAAGGLLACNPPYGERLGEREELAALYATMARVLAERFDGWTLATVSPDERLPVALGLPQRTHVETMNGRIPVAMRVFDVTAGAARPRAVGAAAVDTEAFGNRLRKRAKHLGKWARREGVTCYRVYDADLPDFNVAIDLYGGAGPDAGRRWLHVAEYAAPSDIEADVAAARLSAAVPVAAEVLGIAADDVFVKRRERQRGAAQYERVSERAAIGVVAEDGLLFEVNLSDYLDTGLFLDHRITRHMLREMAEGARFLNLFAYTGTASVYAAAGGAASTTTVDLSATYLAWAERNMVRNGFGGPEHELVRADVMQWVRNAQAEGERFDLIFCDPPTFSTSKRMQETLDIQRDHVRLLRDVGGLLAEGGTLVFSTNRKGFRLDVDGVAAAGLVARDITARTIPPDFERHAGIHHAFEVRRAGGVT
ncbi:MAG: bifunctional 23S rRNA (guanine(2069)-N(7))-methyltransferase RlmK/23S rRNA (guanine(2445)-N(2))-methyltransferase RlmL [Coriobacteriales bacterium]|nr:bifunctional 23S rRNA (guanine(2069)-N(7))-methyltransferase RlmK/23S rRNA (guanine(2445)-N(2))-methyltransferase RlmL [Coriobacteriales bacterium]